MRVSVFGLGYVGSVTAASLAREGHEVVGVDVDAGKVGAINAGRAPVGEPGLDELVREMQRVGRLRATVVAAEAIAASEIAFVCVGTPSAPSGEPDLSAIQRVGCEIGAALRGRELAVVLRSTVLPGTTEGMLARALGEGADGQHGRVALAYNPELMREGTALRDFASPPFNLIGCADPRTASRLRSIYARVDAPLYETNIRAAEMVKYACNAFHALKICFANELAALCGSLEVDGDEVLRIFRLDRKLNVSDAYLRPGFAFGGSCLPKDVRALAQAARRTGVQTPLLGSILGSNEQQIRRAVTAVLATGRRKVGLLGLAFKPGTDDVRESPYLALADALRGWGCDVRVFDRHVVAGALIGKNRDFLLQHPGLEARLCKTPGDLAAHAEVLVIGHEDPSAQRAILRARPDCIVLDLTRSRGARPLSEPRGPSLWPRIGLGSLLLLLGCATPTPPPKRDAEAALPAVGVETLSAARPPAKSADVPTIEETRVHKVRGGDDLQDALDDARPGDTLVLDPGAVFEGPFVLPRHDGDGWITIRGARSQGRASPERAVAMPKLVAASEAIVLAAPGAHHWRLAGLELRPVDGRFLHNLVLLGEATTPSDELPHAIVIEGCYLHGDPALGSRRGIALNSANSAVIDSYFADFKEQGADSQAIAGWAGPGPFLVSNNYLEGAGENILFGGADPPEPERSPADIVIRGNHLAKPLAWKPGEGDFRGTRWTVKNLLELKNAKRVRIEGNLLEHNWPDAQNGFAVLFTVRNQEGTAPWSAVEDVTFQGNVVRHVASGVSILGRDDARGGASARTERIVIRDNFFDDVGGARWGGAGTLFQLLEGTAGVVIEHNTALHTGNVITADGAPHERFVFRHNVVAHNLYGIFGSGVGVGNPAIAHYFPGSRVEGNVLAGGPADFYPPGNFFPPKLAVERVDGAPAYAPGAEGRDIGADPVIIKSALAAH